MPQEIGRTGIDAIGAVKKTARSRRDPEPGQAPRVTLDKTLGIEIGEPAGDVATGKFAVTDAVRQPYGIVHGGAFLTLAESITSVATAMAVKDDGMLAMGQEINASLMRPISEGHVHGTATVRRRGRTAWVWEVEITDDDDRALRPDPRHDRSPPGSRRAEPESATALIKRLVD